MATRKLLLGPAETAKRLGISRSVLYRLWQKKEGPPRVKLGRKKFVAVNELNEWLDNLERVDGITTVRLEPRLQITIDDTINREKRLISDEA